MMFNNLKSSPNILLFIATIGCFVAGTLTSLAFAPWHYSWFAILAPFMLITICGDSTPRRAFGFGWAYGVGLFTFGCSWVYISMHLYGNMSGSLAFFFTLVFVGFLGSYYGLILGLAQKIVPTPRHTLKVCVVLPALWTLGEGLREIAFSGFPWLMLGVSQVSSPLASFAPILGTPFITFLCILTAGLLYQILRAQYVKTKIFYTALFLFIYGIGAKLYPHKTMWTNPLPSSVHVSIIQANIPQLMKWDPRQIDEVWETYWQLTQPLWQQDLLVWPESAVPAQVDELQTPLNNLSQFAKNHNATVILGLPKQLPAVSGAPAPWKFYNTLQMLGASLGEYSKRHLVPFGEYIPYAQAFGKFLDLLKIPTSNFMPGAAKQPLIMIQGHPLASFICYEIAYLPLVLSDLPKAQAIVTISDDTWFGRSIAAFQHLQIAQMRSLETNRAQIFSTNSGPSAFIGSDGQIQRQAAFFKQQVLTAPLEFRTGSTPLVWLGVYPFYGICGLLVFFVGLVCKRRRGFLRFKTAVSYRQFSFK